MSWRACDFPARNLVNIAGNLAHGNVITSSLNLFRSRTERQEDWHWGLTPDIEVIRYLPIFARAHGHSGFGARFGGGKNTRVQS